MITSHVYIIYKTIPPLDTTWYTIWAKVIVIVATNRRVVTEGEAIEGVGAFQGGNQWQWYGWNSAKPMSIGWLDQRGASEPRLEICWRRQEL